MKQAALPLLLTLLVISSCREGQSKPGIPSDEQRLALFKATPQEVLKPTRWDTGDTTMGNEDRLDLFYPHAQNLKGGYLGVGSLQNFILGAWARSEYMWLMDFTRIVVATNQIHIAFIKESGIAEDYISLWGKKNQQQAYAIIEKHFKNEKDYAFIKRSFRQANFYVNKRINLDLMLSKKRKYPLWLTDNEQYQHIRKLALGGRIQAIRGDLSGKTTVKGVGATAKKMGLVMRLLYFSNAEEYVAVCWVPCNKNFMDNILSLPVDEKTLVFRTVSSPNRRIYTWAPGSELTTNRGFHYNIMPGNLFQQWMSYDGRFGMPQMLKGAKVNAAEGFSRAIQPPPQEAGKKGDNNNGAKKNAP